MSEFDDAVRQAIKNGDIDSLSRLVATEGAVAARLEDNPNQLTSLHHAAGAGRLEVVRYLLAIGADSRGSRINNFTPLHAASMQGHADICVLLLSAGAEVNSQTSPQGYSPLHSAAFAGHLHTIQVLLARGADRSLLNYRGERPADTARRQGQIEAEQCLEQG